MRTDLLAVSFILAFLALSSVDIAVGYIQRNTVIFNFVLSCALIIIVELVS